ncbi:lipopolysaccharide biosynthesis protein [Enterococcus sp. DIV0996a]|uniref:lipopolysaccharide biosynthesis protein n=1 Tax=Enterococcus sp. DIV0996a TaxID=2774790 RepID=UPI003F1E6D64
MNQFMKKFFFFSAGPIGGALISLITIPVTTYFISPEEFGKAGVFTMVYGLLLTFSYLGLDQAYSREYHYTEDKVGLLLNAIIVPIIAGVFFFTILLIFRNEVSYWIFGDSNYYELIILLGLAMIFAVFERFLLMWIRMDERALEYSFFSIILKLIVLVTTILFLLLGMRNFKVIVYSTLIGQMIGDLYLIIRYRKIFKEFKRSSISKQLIKSLLIFGFPLLISVSLNYFLNAASTFFLRFYGDFYELGIYSAGQKVANFLNIVQLSFTSFWVPLSYRWYKEKREFLNFQFVSDLLLLLATIGFFILALTKRVIVVMLSSNYSQAQYIICFLALVPILYTLSETTTLGIVFSKKSYLNIYVSLISVITSAVLAMGLIPVWSEKGAAISISIGYVIFFFVRTFFSKRNEFNIKITKHVLQIGLLLIVSFINSFTLQYINLFNIIFLFVSLLMQIGTFKQLIDIKKNPYKYNLS